MNVSTLSRFLLVALMLALWTGCTEIASTKVPAAFIIPKNRHVLVFVESRSDWGVPLDIPTSLAKNLTEHLYHYKEADVLVTPEKVTALKMDPASDKFDVMTFARKTDADIVVYVDLWQFQAQTTSQGLLTEGVAQALVRVVDRDGNRLWPAGEVIPYAVESTVPAAPAEDQDVSVVRKKMLEDLTVRIGRLFQEYAKDDKYLGR